MKCTISSQNLPFAKRCKLVCCMKIYEFLSALHRMCDFTEEFLGCFDVS